MKTAAKADIDFDFVLFCFVLSFVPSHIIYMIDVVLHMLSRARVMLLCLQLNTLDRVQMYNYDSIRLYAFVCADRYAG